MPVLKDNVPQETDNSSLTRTITHYPRTQSQDIPLSWPSCNLQWHHQQAISISAFDYSPTFINTYLTGSRVVIIRKGHNQNCVFTRICSRDNPLSSRSKPRRDVRIEIVHLRMVILVDIGHCEVSSRRGWVLFDNGSKRALPLIAENNNPHVTFLSDTISLQSRLYQLPSSNAQYPLLLIFPFTTTPVIDSHVESVI